MCGKLNNGLSNAQYCRGSCVFLLLAFGLFFTLINPIWVGDFMTGNFFFHLKTTAATPHFAFLRMLRVR
jgi:hypothetical protein